MPDPVWFWQRIVSPHMAGLGYPHNFVLESYMATGVFFGSLLVISVLLLCRRAVSALLNNMQAGWVSLLFFQHLIGAQFSGALYGSTYMWASFGIILSLRKNIVINNKNIINNTQPIRIVIQ